MKRASINLQLQGLISFYITGDTLYGNVHMLGNL